MKDYCTDMQELLTCYTTYEFSLLPCEEINENQMLFPFDSVYELDLHLICLGSRIFVYTVLEGWSLSVDFQWNNKYISNISKKTAH